MILYKKILVIIAIISVQISYIHSATPCDIPDDPAGNSLSDSCYENITVTSIDSSIKSTVQKCTTSSEQTDTDNSLKDAVYATLDSINLHDLYDTIPGMTYPYPVEYWFPEAYNTISAYGIEAVPYILEYILEYELSLTETSYNSFEQDDIDFFMATAYAMLGVEGECYIHWINPAENTTSWFSAGWYAHYLLLYLNEYGLHPIYPFLSAEEANVAQDRIYRLLDDVDFTFEIYLPLSHYQAEVERVTVFGQYAVPQILSYIMEHEGQELTADEEMNLGVLLHCAYRMLGVESTADWHMPAEPVSSTTDPFPYTRELIAHLGDYGLTMPDSSTP